LYRKNHQRALDAMQLNLEAESRNKMDAMRVKKKLEQDINELEVTLDAVNKARAETERNFKKYQQQIRDLQQVRLVIIATSYRRGSSGTICPPPMAVRLAADLRPVRGRVRCPHVSGGRPAAGS